MAITLPRYVSAKPLKSGATAFYWNAPKHYRDQGCPWKSAALGEGLSQADLDAAAELWNQRFDEWKLQKHNPIPERPIGDHFRYATVGWLLDYYLTTDAFLQRVAEPSRPDYRRILKRVAELRSERLGNRCGDINVKDFSVKTANRIYDRFAETEALRSAEKVLMYCKTAWERMAPHFPTMFRKDVPNPWDGVTAKRRDKMKKTHVDRKTVYLFANGAADAGKPEIGFAAILAYEWFMRPSSISAGFAQWGGYRPSANPDKFLIRHRKNGGEVNHPLEMERDGETILFYPEAEAILARVPRRGLSIVTKANGDLFGDTTLLPKAVREMADHLGMKGFTLDKARHGGMTELEEAGLSEGQGKALSTHRTNAYRVYAKETETRVLKATMKRFGHSESPENPTESTAEKGQKTG